jgi:hypothetical protein
MSHFHVETDNRRWDQQITPVAEDPANIHPSFISALTTLSTSLTHLSSTIPPTPLLRIYRSITQNLTTHISHRAVYSGWSKFTPIGGQSFQQEINDLIHTAQESLVVIPGEVVSRQWRSLVDIGKVLALPNERVEDGATFQEAMEVAWSGDEGVRRFCARLGVDLGPGVLQALLRRRVECWR